MTAAGRARAFRWTPATPCDDSCVPGRDAEPVVPLGFQLRRWLALAGVFALAVPVSWVFPLLPKGVRGRLASSGARGILRALGVRVVADPPRPGPALVVGNHISWLDGLVLLAREPLHQVAKSEIRDIPVFGALAARAGTVFIERDRLSTLPGTVAEMRARLASGTSVAVFPEGTTRCAVAGTVLRPASFQAAVEAGVAVRPVRVEYRGPGGRVAASAAFLGEEEVLGSLRRVIRARGLSVHVREGRTLWPGAGSGQAAGERGGAAGPARERRESAARAPAGLERRELATRAQAEILGAPVVSAPELRVAA
ncbi:lysophospholipid acyltransferase family protein [Crossiella sp. NPDC003009]